MQLTALHLKLAMGQSHRGIIWNAELVFIVPRPSIPENLHPSSDSGGPVAGVSRNGIEVKNTSSDTLTRAPWILLAPGTHLGALRYVDYIPPVRVRHVLIQITY